MNKPNDDSESDDSQKIKSIPTAFSERAKTAISPKRSVYLLPNLMTTAALFSGFYAIIMSYNGKYELAVIAIFAAMIFDGLDGRIARMTNTQSEFGIQYDSLSDLISFGVAPAILAYTWQLNQWGNIGWAITFIYCACAAIRLARFNVIASQDQDKQFFIGLPSPLAAALVTSFIWLGVDSFSTLNVYLLQTVISVITLAAGLLMVSRFRYYSFKDVNIKGRVPFVVIPMLVVVFALIASHPSMVISALCIIYCSYAPILKLFGYRNKS